MQQQLMGELHNLWLVGGYLARCSCWSEGGKIRRRETSSAAAVTALIIREAVVGGVTRPDGGCGIFLLGLVHAPSRRLCRPKMTALWCWVALD